jgi:hypothetical protein
MPGFTFFRNEEALCSEWLDADLVKLLDYVSTDFFRIEHVMPLLMHLHMETDGRYAG